jgi:hypothetical protein
MSNPYSSSVSPPPAAGAPLVRPIKWSSLAVYFAALSVVVFVLSYWLDFDAAFLGGAAICLTYSLASRNLLARAHRRGIRLSRRGRYEEAIQAFQESYAFFGRHPWLDRYRAITMFSAGAMSYREMAMVNMAFSYTQIGEGAKAKAIYFAVRDEYPDNNMAIAALRMMESAEGIARENKQSLHTGT